MASLLLTLGLGPVFAAAPPAQQGQTVAGTDVILLAEETYFPAHVPAPSAGTELSGLSTPVVVNFNPSGCSGTVASWPAEAQTAFNHAAALWSGFLNGSQPIEIDACWRTDLGSGSLGRARPVTLHLNFSGSPVPNTHYPAALANQLAGGDLNHSDGTDWDGNGQDADSEIRVDLNGNRANWYFGLTGNTPGTDYNFVAAALHEIGHGLGLIGSMSLDDGLGMAECTGTSGIGCWGFGSSSPYVYDRHTENGTGQSLLDTNQFPNPSAALAAQLVSQNVFFDGVNTRHANGGSPAELYAPQSWNAGSSYAHLGEGFNNTVNALMTFSLNLGETNAHPGPVVLGMLRDLSWPVQTGAELLVEKTVSDSLAVPGQSLTYEIALNNGGPTTLNNLAITDVVPPYTTLNVASLSPDATFSGLEAGSIITWTTNTSLAQGQSLNRSFKVNLTSNAPGGTAITNTATVVAANLPEPRQSNTVATIVNNVASCGFSDGFEDGQLSDFWDTTITNQGLVRVVSTITDIDPETHSPHSGNYQVVLEDNIPGGQSSQAALILTLDLVGRTNVSLNFWWHENEDENNPADGVFVSDDFGATWQPALSFNNGPQSWRQDILDLDALAATYGLAFNDHFQVKFQFEDNADFENNDGYALDDVQVICNTQPRLMVAKTVNLAAAPAGTTLDYTIYVTNTTISTADNIVIVDSVPEQTSLNAGSLSGDASQGHDLVIWNTGQDLSYNEALTRTFSVAIDDDLAVGSSITNSAYGSAANATVAVSNLATTAIITPPDKILSMAKWVETASTPAQPGEAVTYTLEITNHTFETLSGVQVVDSLPNYIVGSDLNQLVTLPADDSLILTIAGSLDGSTPTDTIINNTAFYTHTATSGQAMAVFNTMDTIAPTMPLTDPNTGSALITPTLGFSISTHSPRLVWHPATDNIKLAHYRLVITPTAPISGVVSAFVTTTTQAEFSPKWLENGIYSWTIRAYDAAGNASAFAPAETFVVDLEDVFLPLMLKQ